MIESQCSDRNIISTCNSGVYNFVSESTISWWAIHFKIILYLLVSEGNKTGAAEWALSSTDSTQFISSQD